MSHRLRARASVPQAEFVNATERFPAFVGGFGSGKTEAGILRALRLKFRNPAQDVAYYLPTYDLVRMIGYPRFSDMLTRARVRHAINRSEHVLTISNRGKIIFRTLDNPDRIVGYEVADSVVDELDTLKPADARNAWRKIIARNRQKKSGDEPNTVAVATTPEGFRFVYEQWAKAPAPDYRLIRASTQSNARNLPEGYIEALRQSYPPQLIAAYLDGQFVNLNAGAVYPDFDRRANGTDETIARAEPLHIGLDFNVYNCTAVVGVVRAGEPRILAELTKLRDTPATIAAIRDRYAGHAITVYPDASGDSDRTVNASETDISLLRRAGFTVCAHPRNPLIKDRVMAVNALILNGDGRRTLRINAAACPALTEAIEQQVYDANGQPDKTAGLDHLADALGYWLHYRWPIVRPQAAQVRLVGL